MRRGEENIAGAEDDFFFQRGSAGGGEVEEAGEFGPEHVATALGPDFGSRGEGALDGGGGQGPAAGIALAETGEVGIDGTGLEEAAEGDFGDDGAMHIGLHFSLGGLLVHGAGDADANAQTGGDGFGKAGDEANGRAVVEGTEGRRGAGIDELGVDVVLDDSDAVAAADLDQFGAICLGDGGAAGIGQGGAGEEALRLPLAEEGIDFGEVDALRAADGDGEDAAAAGRDELEERVVNGDVAGDDVAGLGEDFEHDLEALLTTGNGEELASLDVGPTLLQALGEEFAQARIALRVMVGEHGGAIGFEATLHGGVEGFGGEGFEAGDASGEIDEPWFTGFAHKVDQTARRREGERGGHSGTCGVEWGGWQREEVGAGADEDEDDENEEEGGRGRENGGGGG